jgi:hypothetical protein
LPGIDVHEARAVGAKISSIQSELGLDVDQVGKVVLEGESSGSGIGPRTGMIPAAGRSFRSWGANGPNPAPVAGRPCAEVGDACGKI